MRKNKKMCCKLAIGLAMVMMASIASNAAPMLYDFTLDTTVFGGPNGSLVADKITGNYQEVLTVTGPGTFQVLAYWDAGQFVKDDGGTAIPANQSGLGFYYSIYGVFESSGTFTPNGSGGYNFSGGDGYLEVWVDQNVDSYPKTLPTDATNDVTDINIANAGDDLMLGSADLYTGAGHEYGGIATGDFGLLFNPFTLTPLGKTFFIEPVPFYAQVILKGQFNSFVPEGSQVINGSADAFFSPIPEPATLSLLGLGLLGVAAFRMKRRTNK